MIQIKKIGLTALLGVMACTSAQAQFVFGNTGLMHLPTGDMQQDKTVMVGAGWLAKQATPNATGYGWAQDPTWNYYLNVTIFPWMEVSYTCTMIRGKYLAASRGYPEEYFKYWTNQDRHFDFRFRLWKEGWWQAWTPQVVVGFNDALHTFGGNGSSLVGTTDEGNGYWGRMYVAATKHFQLNGVGELGMHAAYMYNDRQDFLYKGVGVGANLSLNGVHTGTNWLNAALHGVNVLAEYDTRTFNAGLGYDVPLLKRKNGQEALSMHLVSELNELQYFSGGVYFKVHLK